jgi:hypothetical protein
MRFKREHPPSDPRLVLGSTRGFNDTAEAVPVPERVIRGTGKRCQVGIQHGPFVDGSPKEQAFGAAAHGRERGPNQQLSGTGCFEKLGSPGHLPRTRVVEPLGG